MIANYFNAENKLASTVVYKVPEEISRLFEGQSFPVLWDDRLYMATYEREIDGLFLHFEIKKEDIIRRATKEMQSRLQDVIEETKAENEEYMSAVFEFLESVRPPWD